MIKTCKQFLLYSSLVLLVLGSALGQSDKVDLANIASTDSNFIANISNAVEEVRKVVVDTAPVKVVPNQIDEVSQYAETLNFSLFVNNLKVANGSFNLRDILKAKENLYKVGTDLTEYKVIYAGLIVKLDKKNPTVLAQILESFGDVEYIPYRYMASPLCYNDAFLGVYCEFDFQKGANLQVNFNAKIAISYGICESGINENTMNFIHAAIRTLIRNHKEVLTGKINSTSEQAAAFVFNNKLYDEVIDKRTQAQQLGDVTQLFVEKTAFCSECQKAVEKATASLSSTQANFDKFKPLSEQNARELTDMNNRKGLLEKDQADKSSKTKILEDARARLRDNPSLLQNLYDTYTSGVYPFSDASTCTVRNRLYNIPATLVNPNMKAQLSSVATVPTCPFTMNLFYGEEPYNPTRMTDIVCTNCENNATGWNDMGDSMVYLDRHNIACPSGTALNAFQFENTSNQIRISYRCIRASNISSSCSSQQTPWNSEGKEFYFLDRHFLDCGVPGRVVNSFRLIRSSGRIALQYTCCNVSNGVASWYRSRQADSFEGHRGNTIGRLSAVVCQDNAALGWFLLQNNWDKTRFEYGCVTVNSNKSSTNITRTTPINSVVNGSVFSLDRHNINCFDNGSVLSSFRLENQPNAQIRFHFSCVSHPSITNDCNTNYTQWDDVNSDENKSIHFLDRHYLTCGSKAALKGFQMERSGQRLRFRYGCCRANVENPYIQAEARTDSGNFTIQYFDRQFLVARPDEVINSVRMGINTYNPNLIRLVAEYSRLVK